MEKKIETVSDFGEVVVTARKASALRQVDAAYLIGVSPPVLNKLEQGKEVWLSKALTICKGLGIEIVLRFPDEAESS